uniref:Phenylacetic acid degradation protein n=1 Tax=uncultured bacterium pAW1 TaxID=1781155 RepID=A0A1C9U4P1_9BACT|nr:phenylacetic acid degradation protein [uncultured bacterium pAW1]
MLGDQNHVNLEANAGSTMTSFEPKRKNFRDEVLAIHQASAFPHHLGVEIVRVEPGEVEGIMAARPEMTQHQGVMHAGALITFLDHVAGMAACSLTPEGQTVVSVTLHVSMLRPSTAPFYRTIARVVKAGRQIYVVDSTVLAEGENGSSESVRATITLMTVPEGKD